jgi:predicted DNA-binding ArsR family transcriptional regulator
MKVVKKARIINESVDMVPLFMVFCIKKNKTIFDQLVAAWKTERELEEEMGEEVASGLRILEESNLLESNWRTPREGKSPEKEFHSSYTKVIVNFQCSLKDFSDIILVASMEEDEFCEIEKPIIATISQNKSLNSVNMLSKDLNISPTFLKAIIKRSSQINIRGQRLKLR